MYVLNKVKGMKLFMYIESKIENPVCIIFGDTENVILADEENKQNIPLIPGVMFGGNHYGFVLITNINGKQREMIYPTQCKIEAIGIENGTLKVFEEGKKNSWRFNKSGKLEHSIFGEFTDEFRSGFNTILEHYDIFMSEPLLKNPLRVKISRNPQKNVILKDELIKQDLPLYPGTMLGTEHYGFILMIDTDKGQKEVFYPTQNRIDAIGIEKNEFGDLKVFENGKYHPWIFSCNGKFKQEASYNPYSKKDKVFVEDIYGLNMEEIADCFTLKMKK